MRGLRGIFRDIGWGDMARRGIIVFLAVAGLLYAFVLIVDPYDTLPFSPPFDRAPSTTNQRYSYPAVAMDPSFDSAVIGTSVVRLLKPSELEAAFGGRFANMAMNSGMPYEQSEILGLFERNRPEGQTIKTVVFGIDDVWCGQTASPKLTVRPFPPWLYDDNRWNDALYLFNLSALEQAGRQLFQILGLREEKYQRNGYRNFLPDASEYDLAKARAAIYGGGPIELQPPVEPPADNYAELRETMTFPDLDILKSITASLPKSAMKLYLGVPVHARAAAAPGSEAEARWRECMSRIAKIGAEFGNAYVLDFRIRSAITMEDRNYWDNLHFGPETASKVISLTADAVTAGQATDPAYRFVLPE